MDPRVVFAFDGGAAAAAEIGRRAAARGAEIVTVTLDLGEGEVLEAIRDRALAAGAVRAHVLDVRDQFAREYLLPALRAGVLAPEGGPDGPPPRARVALRRALMDRTLAEIAALEGGALVVPAVEAERASGDRAVAAGVAAQVRIAFAHGAPTGLNGIAMPLADLFVSLGTIAAGHGAAPEAADRVLQAAHAELLRAALPADLVDLCGELGRRYAAALASGAWSSPLRAALDAFFAEAERPASGTVQMNLVGGGCAAAGVTREGAHG